MNVKFLNKKKFIFFICGVIFIIIIFVLFFINFNNRNYKNLNIGNNNSNKTLEEVEQYILNINSFEATLEVTIKSNKTTNKYVISQKHNKNEDIQEVIEPDNVKGVKLIYKDNILKVENTKLSLESIYNNYPYIEDNNLWLNSFIAEYKNSSNKNISEQGKNIIMKIQIKDGNKVEYKQLFLDKKTLIPTKLLIQDNDKNEIIYILYNKIELSY